MERAAGTQTCRLNETHLALCHSGAGNQPMHAEQPALITPARTWFEPAPDGQRTKSIQRVFLRVLGVQALAIEEFEAVLPQRYSLTAGADQMHLDALVERLVTGVVVKALDPEIAPKLTIRAHQQVAVEAAVTPSASL